METIQNLHRSRKQRLKTMRIFFLSFMCLTVWQAASAQRVQYPATGLITVPRWEGSGIPEGWEPPAHAGRMIERGAMPSGEDDPRSKFDTPVTDDPDALVTDGNAPNPFARTSQGVVVSVGRSFVANNLSIYTPCDNAMAISDSGYIVSGDNYTVEYYDETPDTLLQHQEYHTFYNDPLLLGVPFDPRIIYDRYSHRFILVTLAYADSAANLILLSISKNQDPRNGWHHYRINSDTLTENKWLDFPTLGVNKHELFISGNVFADDGTGFSGNKLFQIRKRELLDGQPMVCRVWNDVRDADGALGYTLLPLSDGLMRDKYDRGIYLVSTDLVSQGLSSNDLNWYFLTDSLDALGVTIQAHETPAGVAYSDPFAAFQLNGPEPIRIGDSKAASGFILDGVINFVHAKNTNNYSTLVLNRLDINTNTNQRFPWGFSAGQIDYCFPSIAFWGADSSDADNILMCFQRTGSTIFPELMVVNFQGGAFAPTSTVVRQGDGFIDINPIAGQVERWGDYTAIQRRYAANPKACWLAGSYPFGSNPDFYGQANGLNTYIAEIADSLAIGAAATVDKKATFVIYPNPAHSTFTLQLQNLPSVPSRLQVFDQLGRLITDVELQGATLQKVDCGGWGNGVYLIGLTH